MVNVKYLAVILLIISLSVCAFSQEADEDSDKYTTQNVIITTIYSTEMGQIVEYNANNKKQTAYLPHRFFEEGIAVNIIERDGTLTPQMNIVYKNWQQYRVKIYIAPVLLGPTYKVMDYLPPAIQEKFKNTKELTIPLWEEEEENGPTESSE